MAAVNTSRRKWLYVAWAVAVVMFILAVTHSTSLRSASQEWPSSNAGKKIGGTGSKSRASIREHMQMAEASWAKTVKQRHELIRRDWGSIDKLPLFVILPYPSGLIENVLLNIFQLVGNRPQQLLPHAVYNMGPDAGIIWVSTRDGTSRPHGRWRQVGLWYVQDRRICQGQTMHNL
jgi:hypothetical protein